MQLGANYKLRTGTVSGAMSSVDSETIFADAPRPQGGRLPLLEKPDLGLEVNEAAVEEFTEG